MSVLRTWINSNSMRLVNCPNCTLLLIKIEGAVPYNPRRHWLRGWATVFLSPLLLQHCGSETQSAKNASPRSLIDAVLAHSTVPIRQRVASQRQT